MKNRSDTKGETNNTEILELASISCLWWINFQSLSKI